MSDETAGMPVHRIRRGAIGLLPAVILTAMASGQGLQLGADTKPSLPLGASTAAMELVGRLEIEVADRQSQRRSLEEREAAVVLASANVRIIATDLLGLQSSADPSSAVGVLMGWKLANGRDRIDGALRELLRRLDDSGADERRAESALFLVHRFNRESVRLFETVQTTDVASLDQAVPAILAALTEAVTLIEGTTVRSHWPIEQVEWEGGPRLTAGQGWPPSMGQLQERLATATVPPAVDIALAQQLARPSPPETQGDRDPVLIGLRRRIDRLLTACQLLWETPWLDAEARQSLAARLESVAGRIGEPQVAAELEELDQLAGLVDRMSEVRTDCWVDFDPVREAVGSMFARSSGGAGQRSAVRALSMATQRTLEHCRLGGVDLPRDLRATYLQLDRGYREAETALVERINRFVAVPNAAADPALGTLLADQQEYLDDLGRVRMVPGWVEELAAIHPECGNTFYEQTQRMCQWLVDPNRRPDAVRAMEQFEHQRSLFLELPGEAGLRGGEPWVCDVAGSQRVHLLREIDHQRRRWAQRWGEGNAASRPAARLLQLRRLGRHLEAAAAIRATAGEPHALDRWGAWELNGAAALVDVERWQVQLRAAITQAVRRSQSGLQRQLTQLERNWAMATLAGWLTATMSDAGIELPGGASGVLGQLVVPPSHDAWLGEQRVELATLCCATIELEHARAINEAGQVKSLQKFIDHLARDVMAIQEDTPTAFPVIPGFDGTAAE